MKCLTHKTRDAFGNKETQQSRNKYKKIEVKSLKIDSNLSIEEIKSTSDANVKNKQCC